LIVFFQKPFERMLPKQHAKTHLHVFLKTIHPQILVTQGIDKCGNQNTLSAWLLLKFIDSL